MLRSNFAEFENKSNVAYATLKEDRDVEVRELKKGLEDSTAKTNSSMEEMAKLQQSHQMAIMNAELQLEELRISNSNLNIACDKASTDLESFKMQADAIRSELASSKQELSNANASWNRDRNTMEQLQNAGSN
jgi:hypothetical protein